MDLITILKCKQHINLYEESKALQYLERLGAIDNNINTFLDIADVCISIGQFKKGYNWVNKAISQSKSLGKSYFKRADLLVALVETNMSDDIDFCDHDVSNINTSKIEEKFLNLCKQNLEQ